MHTSDSELIRRSRMGKPGFEELYGRYARRIYNLAYRVVGAGRDPEELTQEIFLQAYASLGRFQGKSAFYTWLHRIGFNVCLQHLRLRGRRHETIGLEGLPMKALTARNAEDPLVTVERRDLARLLEASLERITDNQKIVVVLGPIEGHTYTEVAEILGLPAATVKSRLHRARVNLRRLCGRDPETGAELAGAQAGPSAPRAMEPDLQCDWSQSSK